MGVLLCECKLSYIVRKKKVWIKKKCLKKVPVTLPILPVTLAQHTKQCNEMHNSKYSNI